MSALPPKADMCGATRDVRFVPIADIAGRSVATGSRFLCVLDFLTSCAIIGTPDSRNVMLHGVLQDVLGARMDHALPVVAVHPIEYERVNALSTARTAFSESGMKFGILRMNEKDFRSRLAMAISAEQTTPFPRLPPPNATSLHRGSARRRGQA